APSAPRATQPAAAGSGERTTIAPVITGITTATTTGTATGNVTAAGEKKKLTRAGWAEFIATANVPGMARMLAQHCELTSYEHDAGGQRIDLVLPEAHRHLLEKAYQDKLQQHLARELGEAVVLRVRLGAPQNETPVELAARARQMRQVDAVAAIESDPFVRDLIEQFDARLDEGSIVPSNAAPADNVVPGVAPDPGAAARTGPDSSLQSASAVRASNPSQREPT
ncbi:MAG: hypothetical protein H7125_15830, partial [Proteobacteria bacterium]|nr:hypothetical protein [Burkholderiales bacterium]